MSTSPKNTIAFFGATGDCAGHTLATALKNGHECIALARTPAKLTKSMVEKGVDSTTLDKLLTIIPGNVKDVSAVKQALQINNKMVNAIVSGIGGAPKLQWSIIEPVSLTDVTICQDAGATILAAAQGVAKETRTPATERPLFINVSTTGISPKGTPRDVPLLFIPLYKWCLHVPHEDKRILELKLAEHVELPEGERGISGYVNVKPSLLIDGWGKGPVRAGSTAKPAVGYTIEREAVGEFMFENLVKDLKEAWRNECVSITY